MQKPVILKKDIEKRLHVDNLPLDVQEKIWATVNEGWDKVFYNPTVGKIIFYDADHLYFIDVINLVANGYIEVIGL